MSCVCILTPVVIAAWPAFSAAVVSAASSLGYAVLAEGEVVAAARGSKSIELEIEQSQLVTGQLGRAQRISVSRGGVIVTFARDARGKASLCVEGNGHSEAALRAAGEELSKAVIQHYVFQRLQEEMRGRGFEIVEEEHKEDRSIRLKVRRWEN